jgi:endonuclease/exonuclease/phosphatase family metal-dependent hydrolase
LGRLLPYSEQDPAPGATGSALFSRFPLTGAGHTALPHTFFQAYATVLVPGAQPVYVRSVHTRAPTTRQAIPAWHRDLTREPAATPRAGARMLIGDFNATLDHATMRRLIDTGYHDVASQVGDGSVATWPYDGRFVPKITLDHILVDPRVGAASFEARRDPGSDHRAIFATLTVPPA